MRLFAKPPWAEEFRCKCGGKIMIQPEAAMMPISKVSDLDIDADDENRSVRLSATVGINYICCGCHKQWQDFKSDWAFLISVEAWDNHIQRQRYINHNNDEWESKEK